MNRINLFLLGIKRNFNNTIMKLHSREDFNQFISIYEDIKYKYNYFIFSYDNFTSEYLVEVLMTHLRLNETYSILFKLGFNGNTFYMSGRQIGVIVKDFHDVKYYKEVFRILENRLIDLMEQYKKKKNYRIL
jgi:hypothetical protein